MKSMKSWKVNNILDFITKKQAYVLKHSIKKYYINFFIYYKHFIFINLELNFLPSDINIGFSNLRNDLQANKI